MVLTVTRLLVRAGTKAPPIPGVLHTHADIHVLQPLLLRMRATTHTQCATTRSTSRSSSLLGALRAGLSQVINNTVQMDVRHVQPERNPALTNQLVATARRQPRQDVEDGPPAVHYYAKTTYRANYFYWLLFALSVLASLFYFVVRIYYIASGKMSVTVPVNQVFVTDINGDLTNMTVRELLDETPQGQRIDIGDELPERLLEQDGFEALNNSINDNTYSYWWSCCVLAAEIGGFILVHISQQMFVRQDTKFYPLPPEHVAQLRDVRPLLLLCCCMLLLLLRGVAVCSVLLCKSVLLADNL